MNKNLERQEGIIAFLVIVAVGSAILGMIVKDTILMYGGVAIILLDTVLLLDYTKRKNLTNTTSKPSMEEKK